MDQLQEKWLGADYLAVMTYERGDPSYETRDGLLAFLTDGSPQLRISYSIVRQVCYKENGKLLVTEDIPFCAKLYKDGLRAAWAHAEVLRSNLSHKQRKKLFEEFNDPDSSIKVLIMMYDVASQGLNLQKASCKVLSMTPAKKFDPEMQATNRVLRVDQSHEVEIMRIILRNTHDVFREARQTSHMRLEIATQAHRADVRQELVTVLNEYQQTINDWQASIYE